jgi:hypothetical protein
MNSSEIPSSPLAYRIQTSSLSLACNRIFHNIIISQRIHAMSMLLGITIDVIRSVGKVLESVDSEFCHIRPVSRTAKSCEANM